MLTAKAALPVMGAGAVVAVVVVPEVMVVVVVVAAEVVVARDVLVVVDGFLAVDFLSVDCVSSFLAPVVDVSLAGGFVDAVGVGGSDLATEDV